MKVGRIVGSIVVSLSLACAARATPEVDAQVANLTSEDQKVAEEARRTLEAKGADVVPVLFEKLGGRLDPATAAARSSFRQRPRLRQEKAP